MKIYYSYVTLQTPAGIWAVICLLVQREKKDPFVFFVKGLDLDCVLKSGCFPHNVHSLPQSIYLKKPNGLYMPCSACAPSLPIPIFSFLLSPIYPSCPVPPLMRLIWTVFMSYRHGLHPNAVFKRAVGPIHTHSLYAVSS